MSDSSTTEDPSDCGDDTSTYHGEYDNNNNGPPPTQPFPESSQQSNENDEDLNYLVSIASSDNIENKTEYANLLDMAVVKSNPSNSSNKKYASRQKQYDVSAVNTIKQQMAAIDKWSVKKKRSRKIIEIDFESEADLKKKKREDLKQKKKAAKKEEVKREKINKIRNEHQFTMTQWSGDNYKEDTYNTLSKPPATKPPATKPAPSKPAPTKPTPTKPSSCKKTVRITSPPAATATKSCFETPVSVKAECDDSTYDDGSAMLSQQHKIPIQILRTPPNTERVSSVSSAVTVSVD